MTRKRPAKWIRDMLPKQCCNCGSTNDLTYHHIVPVIYGGTENPRNYAVVCGMCHDKIHYGEKGGIDHSSAVKKGIEAAKHRGVQFGKRPADSEKIMQTIAEHSSLFVDDGAWTESEIMAEVGIKPTVYYKCKRNLLADLEGKIWPHAFAKPHKIRERPLYEWYINKLRSSSDI